MCLPGNTSTHHIKNVVLKRVTALLLYIVMSKIGTFWWPFWNHLPALLKTFAGALQMCEHLQNDAAGCLQMKPIRHAQLKLLRNTGIIVQVAYKIYFGRLYFGHCGRVG